MSQEYIQVGHLNIRSLVPKFNSFKRFITDKNFHIFALSETWLNNFIDNKLVDIDGFSLIRKDRQSRGGGVAFYLSNRYKFNVISTSDRIEQLWISVSINNNSFVFGVCYRPPQMNVKLFTDELEESLSICMQHGEKIYCLGDVNIDFLKPDSPASQYFLPMLDSVGFQQIVDKATHISPHSSSLLDIILCSDSSTIVSVEVGGIDISDHEMIYCKINSNKPILQAMYYTFRDFKALNENLFYQDLQQLPLNNMFYLKSIDDKVELLNSNLLDLFNKHIPLKTVRITKKKAPWLTDNIRLLMTQRDKARSDYKKSPSKPKWEYYKQIRNATNHALSSEKRAYFSYVAKSKKPKELWSELKGLNISKNKKSSLPPGLSDPDMVNNFFLDSIPQNNITHVNMLNYYRSNKICNSSFNFTLVSSEDVQNVIKNLKNSMAGSDSIGINLIKLCCPYILKFIVHIINSMFIECKFPTVWKNALVIPLPKVNDPKDYSDLRPISILPGMSKVAEKIIEIQIRQHLELNGILPAVQSGFRSGYSSTTALLNITDDIIQATDEGKNTALILLDFSKAFDTINHKMLLCILKSCGFAVEGTLLLQTYLEGRSQFVRLDGNVSQSRDIFTGVPQGSILGPLLFSIYTSQFIKFINYCSMHMYADDTQLYLSFNPKDVERVVHEINRDLQTIHDISLQHSLVINPSKSAAILFGNKSTIPNLENLLNIEIMGSPLQFSQNVKNLGLILDNTLRFREHVAKCTQRAYGALRLLYPHRGYIDYGTKKMLCETLVLSQFNYCAPVYGPCLDQNFCNRIQRVQNSCIRFIYGIRKFEHVSHKLHDLHWLNMQNRRHFYSLCLFQKILITKTPPYLYNKISFRSDVHNLNIRFKGLFTPPRHRTSLFERGFKYNIYKLYNKVSSDVHTLNISRFRSTMKNLICASQNINR